MPGVKYSRVDGKTSSSYCSTVTIVAVVAFCLVGVWMFTSSSVVPVQTSNLSTDQENKNVVNENTQVTDNKVNDDTSETSSNDNDGNSQQIEDNNGNLDHGDKNPNPQEMGKPDVLSKQEKPEEAGFKGDNGNVEVNKQSDDNGNQDQEMGKTDLMSKPKNLEEAGSKVDDGNAEENKQIDEPKSDEKDVETNESNVRKGDGAKDIGEIMEKKEEKKDSSEKNGNEMVLPSINKADLLNETATSNGAFSTQASESKNEKEAQKSSDPEKPSVLTWKVCNVTAGPDYIPCLDNIEVVRHLRTTKHYEHRERHCPEDPPTCLVSLPEGYRRPIEWPTSRMKIWYHNVPHTQLAEYKGHQNWVKVEGEHLTFPGGGTQFQHGALHYIDFIQQSVPDIAWGKHSRVVLDVGCGVASFGGFLFERDVITMSLAPKDEHEAQVQFALERGIPAISAVMGTKRLPYPSIVFDVIHCARCRVPWHVDGGKLLLELNRLLRPGGFFVWSATPVYEKLPEDVQIWEDMKKLTKAICWEVVSITQDRLNKVGIAVYRKTTENTCYEQRPQQEPPICLESDDPNAAWNVPLQACMHKVPSAESERGSKWPETWPARLQKPPYWLTSSKVGVYGKPEPDDFNADYEHWKHVVSQSYKTGLGIDWSTVRNVMDMRAVYGGLAAALRDMKIWVMNIISIDAPDTLPIIYERGLFGIYHDWCESFSTYPRTFDLLHADHLFSKVKKKCNFTAFVAEVDRILRPEGKIIVRDNAESIAEAEKMFKSMQWEIRLSYVNGNEGLIYAQKTMWRPKEIETIAYAV